MCKETESIKKSTYLLSTPNLKCGKDNVKMISKLKFTLRFFLKNLKFAT